MFHYSEISLKIPPSPLNKHWSVSLDDSEVLGRVVLWRLLSMISWLSSSPNQNSDHAVGDSNLNTSQCSFFLLTFSCSRLTALFSHELQSRGASAWEKLMIVCASHYLTSLACDAVWRSSDVQSGCILLFTMLHYLLTSVTKSEKLLALEIFLSYDMCIWRKLFQFNFFLFVDKMLYWLFFCTYWGLLQFCLLYYLSSFF